MQFIGLSKDKETSEVVRYELRLYAQDISCIYKDRYGVYLCTSQGKMMMVDHTVDYLKEELGL